METYRYPHFGAVVYVAKFGGVKNAEEIRSRIIKAASLVGPDGDSEREAVNFAFIEAKLISEAIKLFGVSSKTTDLILVHVATSDTDAVEKNMVDVVEGDLVRVSTIPETTSWSDVKKYYKLNGDLALKEAAGDKGRQRTIIDNVVVSTVAMKSVMA
ncbi:hypothetical protein ID866_7275 [Astraeus odoratus]|nr:hypothetical protein ID866_7275 [Astraeus odoratus]